ncbi:tRNA dimethylallyltransferase [Abditibacterium utsteinense]|uniref:tRNA dimethylallyltransferase n=1 Tax=Abditibacterium utsteinense TaxID=1960156 RepID=A0A2S8STR3_9BACT|nr:tRNA (adenosine(37)-N6)-dimethylallyltransferase MiaA [Abditibacterium utsteinense]PQV64187.1 tRNA dimethylallyltransferase [Abditibacterium utsteinense]
MKTHKKLLLCIVGPTASGKSALAMQLCALLNGEIVSCDSMQIYRGCDIATSKPTRHEQNLVPHHLIDICEPNQRFSAAQWAAQAAKCCAEIESRDRVPILCGGTGFWLRALLQPEVLSAVPPNPELRKQLQAELETSGAAAMHEKLSALDAGAAARLHPNDAFRVVRALEIALGEKPESTKNEVLKESDYDAQIFALDWPREMLYARINTRVDAMLEAGFEAELRALRNHWGNDAPALGGVGYQQMLPVLDDPSRFEEGVETWKRDTRRYAKRQITWFAHQLPVSWLSAEGELSELAAQIAKSYKFDGAAV